MAITDHINHRVNPLFDVGAGDNRFVVDMVDAYDPACCGRPARGGRYGRRAMPSGCLHLVQRARASRPRPRSAPPALSADAVGMSTAQNHLARHVGLKVATLSLMNYAAGWCAPARWPRPDNRRRQTAHRRCSACCGRFGLIERYV